MKSPRKLTKKHALIGGAAVAAVAVMGGGAAFAYWTTKGSGEGTAKAAESNGTITLHASFDDGIYPGGERSVAFTADNPGDTNLFVNTITLSEVKVDKDHAACEVADFSMRDVTSETMVAAQAKDQKLNGTGTLTFANTDKDQDACKGAAITLVLSSN